MDDVQVVRFQKHVHNNGALCAYETGDKVPFVIKRVFTVNAQQGDVRGNHAHSECTQLLVCVSGAV